LALRLQSLLITINTTRTYKPCSVIADLHTFQFTVAHAVGFLVSTSRLPATDLNTETSSSNHTLSRHRTTSNSFSHLLRLISPIKSPISNPSYRLSLYRLRTDPTENPTYTVDEACLQLGCHARDVLLLSATVFYGDMFTGPLHSNGSIRHNMKITRPCALKAAIQCRTSRLSGTTNAFFKSVRFLIRLATGWTTERSGFESR
jgi:hypothetical protein